MLYIRVDMNRTIATGHVMRCLSIADAARAMGEETVFITADEIPVELLKSRGYETMVLHTDWTRMMDELPVLTELIEKQGIRSILVDSYQVTEDYLRELGQKTRVCYMDDLNSFDYPVDTLICYAVYADKFNYPARLPSTRLFLGTDYVPLRDRFEGCPPKKIEDEARKVLLLSGGTDPFHVLENFLQALTTDDENWEVAAICGGFHPDHERLVQTYAGWENVHIYSRVEDMERHMQWADLAVSAGGSTLYELCACGTPAISYAMADNQLENVVCFDSEGLIPYAGDLRSENVIRNGMNLLKELRGDRSRRERISLAMQHMVDGRGAKRIAEVLLEKV